MDEKPGNPEKGKIIRMVPDNLREEVPELEPLRNPLPEGMNAAEITLENYRDFFKYDLTIEQKIRILIFILEKTQDDGQKRVVLAQLIELETEEDKKKAWEFQLRQLMIS